MRDASRPDLLSPNFTAGVFAAAGVGAFVSTFPLIIFPPVWLVALLVAGAVFVGGISLVATPLWLVLSRLGFGGRRVASALGGVLAPATWLLLAGFDDGFSRFMLVMLAIGGAVGGWVGWAIAQQPRTDAE